MLGASDPTDVGAVGVEDVYLDPEAVEHEDYKVNKDDLVLGEEVLLATPEHHVPPEVLHMDLEPAPFVGGEADNAWSADDQPMLRHQTEFRRDDEHSDVLLVPDLHVEPDRFTCDLLVFGPRPPSSAPRHPHVIDLGLEVLNFLVNLEDVTPEVLGV
ncbi:hypothetical protein D1007_07194 [Hordeum vulgare]|nr:hypothetical protein D1007_07194 [Hordeum vulgare]